MTLKITWTLLAIAHEIAVFVCVLVVLRRRRNPRGSLAWILGLVFVPVFGLLTFVMFGEPRRGWYRMRRRRTERELEGELEARRIASLAGLGVDAADLSEPLSRLAEFANASGAFPATRGNSVTVFYRSEATFEALFDSINAARSHVHLEYYIFQPDETGRELRDILIKKREEGAEVRLLLDFVGSWWLTRSFLDPLRSAGAEVEFFLPVLPWRGHWRANFRNHRKIAIVDGEIGFLGSQNVGDEYRGRRQKLGPWRDTHLSIRGPAVHDLQEVFVADWHFATKRSLTAPEYFPDQGARGVDVVQLVPSGPGQSIAVMHQMLFAAVSFARESIHIVTPYFVPDDAMLLALKSATCRGAHVEILIPSRTDQRLALWAGRGFYEELLDAGVSIFEHERTMLHSKVMIIDDAWALVGSANMDERSFRLNFEISSILYSAKLVRELGDDFAALRSESRRVAVADVDPKTFVGSVLLGAARLAAPLL